MSLQLEQRDSTEASLQKDFKPKIQLIDQFPQVNVNINLQNCYGKLHVLFYRGKHLFSLGPDYFCFVPAFIIFAAIGIFLTRFVFMSSENMFFCYFTLFLSLLQSLSYFLCATSDPGVILPGGQLCQDDDEGGTRKKRFCKRCGIHMIRNSYHCRDCDVCIKGYDHHCPWVSKCIGHRNIKYFYAFVATTPIFLIYAMVAMMYCLAQQAVKHNAQNLHPKTF